MRTDSINNTRRYSEDYAKFAAQIADDIIAAGYNAISRSSEASWKSHEGAASSRQFLDITYLDKPVNRVVTVDLQYAYTNYINGTSAMDTLNRIVNGIEITINGDKANQIFMKAPEPEIIPRDETCLAPCLDRGVSLKAYHERIGYVAKDRFIYVPSSEEGLRMVETLIRENECACNIDEPEDKCCGNINPNDYEEDRSY